MLDKLKAGLSICDDPSWPNQGRFAKEVGLLRDLFRQRNGLTTAEQIFLKNATAAAALQEKMEQEKHDHVKIKPPASQVRSKVQQKTQFRAFSKAVNVQKVA